MNLLKLIDAFKSPTNALPDHMKSVGEVLTLVLTANHEFKRFLDTIQKNNEFAAKTYLISFCLTCGLEESSEAIELVDFVYQELYSG